MIKARLYCLKRDFFPQVGFENGNPELIEAYRSQIRCMLEFSVAAWNAILTKKQIKQIERVQKCTLA